MRTQFGIAHCLWATVVIAALFATLQLPRAAAQTAILIEVWLGFHVLIALRQKCYAGIFVGVVAALVVGMFFPHRSGTWIPGHSWLGMLMPSQLIPLLVMLGVGGFAQTWFARVYMKELDQEARSRKRRAERYRFRDLPP
ncbi:hypothetical protein TBK1r_66440 [Stieleria magnilauensis]|uniref:Uncharacterized protein n=1 Tax=Stieleria magnilauensis TaxID=2527963 RepID=A0ABX5XZZ9_9BACT|nr:hypothetical protein TBK1r_66440 [Planctomycetes bacterium TBK1r]